MENTAFLLLSCDKYFDIISPFAKLMSRFWSDCPYPKFAATNTRAFKEEGFNPILMGDDSSWSTGLKRACEQLEMLGYKYVLITLEDLFLKDKVNTEKVSAIVSEFIKIDGNYIRFYKHFDPPRRVNSLFGELPKNTPYRQNCVYALWKISTLKNILKDGENAWDFEKIAVERGYEYDGFYAVYENQFKILNTLIKGKWVPSDFRRARRLLPELKTERQKMTIWEELKLNCKRGAFCTVCAVLPQKLQKQILK